VVRGRITNEKGEAIEGVNISIKGGKVIGVTNGNGEFILTNVPDAAVLVFSAVSLETLEMKLNGRTELALSAKTKVSVLDEVQMIAYGSVSKRLNTGSVATVKGEDIQKQPVSNPLAALEGRVPGLQITQQTGVPGGSFKVQIRGQNSLRTAAIGQIEGNDPLYIVDGIPFGAASMQRVSSAMGNTNNATAGSPFNYIDPSNIESIDILKDAEATSIYGSRGANGVILITTKKGAGGKTKLDINAYQGEARVTRITKLLNTQQYLQMRREAFVNDAAVASIPLSNDINGVWDTTRYTDWQQQLIGGTAKYTDLQASVSGGNANTQFLFGGGYHKETTVFPGDFSDQKASVHFSLNHSSENRKFKVTLSVNFVNDNNNLLRTDLTGPAQLLAPDAPAIYDASGKLNWVGRFANPYGSLLERYNAKTTNLITSAVISYELLPGLQVKCNLGYNQIRSDEFIAQPIAANNPANNITTGTAVFGVGGVNNWILEPQLSYSKRVWVGKLEAIAGGSFQENSNKFSGITGTGYTGDNLLNNISFAATKTPVANNSVYRYSAFFGRLKYNVADKYLLTMTARRDGSSRFGEENQFGNFWSAGGAWIFSSERFVNRLLPFISFGKLRAGYGTTGNDQIGDYQYLTSYSVFNYVYQGITGLQPTRLSNPGYGWEINKKMEAALAVGLFKDRLLVDISFYRNRSSSQLVGYPLSTVTGFSTILANYPATVQNTGWEFSVSSTNIKTGEFSWSSNLNLTIPRNKLVSFPGIEKTPYMYYYTVGQSLNIFKGTRLKGVDPATGVYMFLNAQGNTTAGGSLSYPADYLLTETPNGQSWYGGLQNSLQYKGFQLDFLFQFIKQTSINNSYITAGTNSNIPEGYFLSRWQKPGDAAQFEKLSQNFSLSSANNAALSSDYSVSDASFVRLKNLAFSYRLPAAWLNRLHVASARIYLQGQNLFVITGFKGADPENHGGPSGNTLPPLKVITAGIQLTF
jgi:TonB-linked SusC/RagA family outer membrane protein